MDMTLESLQAMIKVSYDNKNKVILLEGKTDLTGNFEYKELGETIGIVDKDDICISFAFTPFSDVNIQVSVPCLDDDTCTPLYKLHQENFIEPIMFDRYGLVGIVSANIPHKNGVVDLGALETYSISKDGYDWLNSTVSIQEIRYMK